MEGQPEAEPEAAPDCEAELLAAAELVLVLEGVGELEGVLEGVEGQENTRRALLPVSTMYTAPAAPATALRGALSCATALRPWVAPAAPVPTRVLALPPAVLTTRTLWLLVSATSRAVPAASAREICQGVKNRGVGPSA